MPSVRLKSPWLGATLWGRAACLRPGQVAVVPMDGQIAHLMNHGVIEVVDPDAVPDTGDDGASSGPAGPVGAKGDTGATGAVGATGAAGAAGTPGAKGDKGDAGSQGAAGAQGPAGATGATGAAGAVGAAGAKGDAGVVYRTGAAAASVPKVWTAIAGPPVSGEITVTIPAGWFTEVHAVGVTVQRDTDDLRQVPQAFVRSRSLTQVVVRVVEAKGVVVGGDPIEPAPGNVLDNTLGKTVNPITVHVVVWGA